MIRDYMQLAQYAKDLPSTHSIHPGARVTALCEDGRVRRAEVTAWPDTFFSAPARVKIAGRNVRGYVGNRDGMIYFAEVMTNAGYPNIRVPGDKPRWRHLDLIRWPVKDGWQRGWVIDNVRVKEGWFTLCTVHDDKGEVERVAVIAALHPKVELVGHTSATTGPADMAEVLNRYGNADASKEEGR